MRRQALVSSVFTAFLVAIVMVFIPPSTSWALKALIGGCVGFLAAILAEKMANAKKT